MLRFENRQEVPLPLHKAWDFFANPHNLPRLTPSHMQFRFLDNLPTGMYSGMILRYKLAPLMGISVESCTKIETIAPQEYFTDVQLQGPFKSWHHEHRFEKVSDTKTLVIDLVHYQLPGGALGKLLGGNLVKKQTEQLFEFRRKALQKILESEKEYHEE